MTRTDLTEKILDIKREKGWSWQYIHEKIGGTSPVLLVGALLGQMKLTKPQVAKAADLFGLDKTEQALINETYEKFKGVVADGRANAHDLNKKEGKALAPNWEDFADGRVMSGTQALNLGLVDELGDFDDAVDRTMNIVHIKDANLVEYRERYDIGNFLSMFGQNGQAKDIKIDVGLDIPKLRAGCLYYLWQMPGY